MKEGPFRFLRDDNPFKVVPNFVVEIVDVKYNSKNVLYVQYKQIKTQIMFQNINRYKYWRKSTDNEALLWFFVIILLTILQEKN